MCSDREILQISGCCSVLSLRYSGWCLGCCLGVARQLLMCSKWFLGHCWVVVRVMWVITDPNLSNHSRLWLGTLFRCISVCLSVGQKS